MYMYMYIYIQIYTHKCLHIDTNTDIDTDTNTNMYMMHMHMLYIDSIYCVCIRWRYHCSILFRDDGLIFKRLRGTPVAKYIIVTLA